MPLLVITDQLVIGFPLSVAVTPGRLSEKVIVTGAAYVVPSVTPAKVGGVLSIQFIVTVVVRRFRRFQVSYHAPVVNGHVPR